VEKGVPEPAAQELRGVYGWADGNLETAIAALEDAIAKRPEDAADAPLAVALGNLGYLRAEAGRLEDAQVALRRAIRVRERLGPADTVELASLWFDLGTVLGRKGATVEALAAHRRALDTIEAKIGPETLEAGESLRAIGRLERDALRFDESVASYRRALSIRRAALGEDSGEVAVSNVELGWSLLAAGLSGEATERFTLAEHVAQTVVGRPSLLVARAMEGRGVADLARGQASKAVVVLEEALMLLERTGSDPAYIARLNYQLSRALAASGGDRERARRLALTAQERLGKPDSTEGRSIAAWLAELEGVKKP
jgi:tetratricopeptide (TPR) repeat protein